MKAASRKRQPQKSVLFPLFLYTTTFTNLPGTTMIFPPPYLPMTIFNRRINLDFILFGAVVLTALTFRLYRLDGESLFMDEIRQAGYYSQDFGWLIGAAASQNQPPLDYWIGHLFWLGFGTGDFIARLPAALFGTASVAVLMLIVRRLANPATALLAGMTLALLPYAIYFSQEARPYAIAIFFFLTFFWQVLRILQAETLSKRQYALLFLLALTFLHTRALAPLAVITASAGLLLLLALFECRPAPSLFARRALALVGVCGAAIAGYLPNLFYLTERARSEGRYVTDTDSVSWEILQQGIERFSPQHLWEALSVQGEPFGILLGLGISAALVWSLRTPADKTRLFVIWLLPCSAVLHLFAFQAKTESLFRPPYAIYLLPLALIVSAWLIHAVVSKLAGPKRLKILALSGAALIGAGWLGTTLADYYLTAKRTDWRGMSIFLRTALKPDKHIVVMESFTEFTQWKPDGYGFWRYSTGEIPLLLLGELEQEKALETYSDIPVVLLFHRHDYRLTSRSPYPFIPARKRYAIGAQNMEQFQFIHRLKQNPNLAVRATQGLSVVQLNRNQGRFAKDLLVLLGQIEPHVKQNSGAVDFYLGCYFLARIVDPGQAEGYLQRAQALVPASRQAVFEARLESIHGYPGLPGNPGEKGDSQKIK